jgi:hypothetical protein
MPGRENPIHRTLTGAASRKNARSVRRSASCSSLFVSVVSREDRKHIPGPHDVAAAASDRFLAAQREGGRVDISTTVAHWGAITATDFFTVEVTWRGLVTFGEHIEIAVPVDVR